MPDSLKPSPGCEIYSMSPKIDRRALLIGGAAAVGFAGSIYFHSRFRPIAPAFIAKGQSYEGDLTRTIGDGLIALGPGTKEGAARDQRPALDL